VEASNQVTTLIHAETYYGETITVPLQELFHRVSAYAVIIEENQILMVKTSNNKWYFPGGGVDIGETLQDGVKREAWEELGVEVVVGPLLYADDVVYFHDPIGNAAQLVRLFYECRPLAREFNFQNAEERNDFLEIGWVSLNGAFADDFLPSTWRALQGIRERLKG
jgi:8-oxo-dGTP pyrophosphatase MutT (NUDIX family)